MNLYIGDKAVVLSSSSRGVGVCDLDTKSRLKQC